MSSKIEQKSKSMREHIKATLVLGMPLVGAQIAHMAISVTDTIMLGWLGVEELAAGVLGAQIIFIVFIFGVGLTHAIVPIAAAAHGRGDETQLRRSVRMGFWVIGVYSVFGLLILWFVKPIYLALGQVPETTVMAETYVRIAMWGLVVALAFMVLRAFLSVLELARIILIASVAGVLLNIVLNYMLIFGNWGAPRLEIKGAAWASLGTSTLMFVVLAIYSVKNHITAPYGIFNRFWRSDFSAFMEVFRLGFPISLTLLAEVGLFAASTIMMGWLGTVALAAQGVALQITSVAFMIPLGLSSAATVRVGNAYGRENWTDINRATWAVVFVGLLSAVFTALVLVIFPEPLSRLFLDFDNENAEAVLIYAVPLLLVAAGFQLVDAAQALIGGVLRGLKDTKRPMQLGVICYWGIGVPTAYLLAFNAGMEGIGIWLGLAIGLAFASIVLFWRYFYLQRKLDPHQVAAKAS